MNTTLELQIAFFFLDNLMDFFSFFSELALLVWRVTKVREENIAGAKRTQTFNCETLYWNVALLVASIHRLTLAYGFLKGWMWVSVTTSAISIQQLSFWNWARKGCLGDKVQLIATQRRKAFTVLEHCWSKLKDLSQSSLFPEGNSLCSLLALALPFKILVYGPGQCDWVGWNLVRFNPWAGCVREATNPCLSPTTISPFSLSEINLN